MHAAGVIECFSDSCAQRRCFLTAIEARSKLVFVVLALVINLLSASVYTPLTIAVVCLVALVSIRVPLKMLLLRLAMPLVMAAVLLVTQLFLYGDTPLFVIPLLGLHLTAYQEGLARGLLVMCRVLSGMSLVLVLSLSTPADQLFRAAGWFRVPLTFIEIALLIYRYIFVLVEELATMQNAQRVRLGYCNWTRSMRSLSMLGACLILRAFDRAERVFDAMMVRGYTGADYRSQEAFGKRDGLVALGLAVVLAGFYLVGKVG